MCAMPAALDGHITCHDGWGSTLFPALPLGQIGKIVDIEQFGPKPDDVKLDVVWYYRPEEALGGRKVGASYTDCQNEEGSCTWLMLELSEICPCIRAERAI